MVVLLFLSIAASIALLSGEKVQQTPADMFKEMGQTATLSCSHSVQSYDQILCWKHKWPLPTATSAFEKLLWFDGKKMMCFLLVLSLAGVCWSLEVHQSPPELIRKSSDNVQILCSHDRTDYRTMLWRQCSDRHVMEQWRRSTLMMTPPNIAASIALLSGEKVQQNPADMFKEMGQTATLSCSHSVQSYNMILWYKNVHTQMHLLGYMYASSSSPEKGVDVEMTGSALEGKTCHLMIQKLTLNSSVCWSLEVHQSPPELVRKSYDNVQIFCSHDRTDYRTMLWYQVSPSETTMKLVGRLSYKDATLETPYKDDFGLSGDLSGNNAKNAYLRGSVLIGTSKKTWWCSCSSALLPALLCSQERKSSRLPPTCSRKWDRRPPSAVLTACRATTRSSEPNLKITPPKVTLLKPSPHECTNQKNATEKKKTLVCVATGFYPDHVSVVWKVDNDEVSGGVATDAQALRSGDHYSITSRLRVPARRWFHPNRNFTCVVKFFNGNETVDYQTSINGEGWSQEGAVTRENFLKISQTAKLSYAVLIAKSCVYGAFVVLLIWKLRVSSGKSD
ncbi:uncharacterized protein LOC129192695 [Dunckerocampus dactyliophorus]|uniref:uncharacterized protein LOC129192695 n=1 Tax=Dunckerocampus dactyliophorus TaxID=161453 RepID=UPI002406F5CC|nr:uncharacterized protein LOC129192695 [Dunckerocampus dactyliophorus]